MIVAENRAKTIEMLPVVVASHTAPFIWYLLRSQLLTKHICEVLQRFPSMGWDRNEAPVSNRGTLAGTCRALEAPHTQSYAVLHCI